MSAKSKWKPTPLHLTLVTRKFWPLSGSTELAVSDLARALKTEGHRIQIITSRWHRSWPESLMIRGIPVRRIARPGQGPWGDFRFQRELARTITQGDLPDGIIVFGNGDEALGKNKQLSEIPILIRVDYRNAAHSDWNLLGNRKRIQSLQRPRAVVADSQNTAEDLLELGIQPNRIHVIPDGIKPDVDLVRSTTDQVNARMALSNAHPVLSIEPGQPLVVCGAVMDHDAGVGDLVEAWKWVQEEMPRAKLWLLGDGPQSGKIWSRVCELDLVYSVILPGYFDDLQAIYAAADLYCHPLRADKACTYLVRAMNEALCPVVTKTAFTRDLVTADREGLVTPTGNPKALAEAILHGLKSRELKRRLGNASRKTVARTHHIRDQACEYLKLIHPKLQPTTTSLP